MKNALLRAVSITQSIAIAETAGWAAESGRAGSKENEKYFNYQGMSLDIVWFWVYIQQYERLGNALERSN